MNVLDSRCSELISLVSGFPPDIVLSGGRPDTKLVNTLHLESNTFIYDVCTYYRLLITILILYYVYYN